MRKPFAFVLTAALALCANLAQAQPQNQDVPLRIVVGYAPGGAIDRVARIVADKLGTKLGTPVIVENRTGAGSRLSAQAVKAAPANQPTLLLYPRPLEHDFQLGRHQIAQRGHLDHAVFRQVGFPDSA